MIVKFQDVLVYAVSTFKKDDKVSRMYSFSYRDEKTNFYRIASVFDKGIGSERLSRGDSLPELLLTMTFGKENKVYFAFIEDLEQKPIKKS